MGSQLPQNGLIKTVAAKSGIGLPHSKTLARFFVHAGIRKGLERAQYSGHLVKSPEFPRFPV
jgi:hypothetical protein